MCTPKVERQHAHESLQMLEHHDALLKLPVADVVGNNTFGIFDPKSWKDLRFDTSPKKIPAKTKRLKKESPTETDNISWSGVSKSAASDILAGKGATAEQLGIQKNIMVDFRVDHTAHKKAFVNMFHLSEEQIAKQQQNTTPTMSNTQQHSTEPLMDKQNDTHKLHKHAAPSEATPVETSKQANVLPPHITSIPSADSHLEHFSQEQHQEAKLSGAPKQSNVLHPSSTSIPSADSHLEHSSQEQHQTAKPSETQKHTNVLPPHITSMPSADSHLEHFSQEQHQEAKLSGAPKQSNVLHPSSTSIPSANSHLEHFSQEQHQTAKPPETPKHTNVLPPHITSMPSADSHFSPTGIADIIAQMQHMVQANGGNTNDLAALLNQAQSLCQVAPLSVAPSTPATTDTPKAADEPSATPSKLNDMEKKRHATDSQKNPENVVCAKPEPSSPSMATKQKRLRTNSVDDCQCVENIPPCTPKRHLDPHPPSDPCVKKARTDIGDGGTVVRENDDADDDDDIYTSTAGGGESVKCIMIREGQLNTMKQHCMYAQTYNFKLDSKKPNLLTVILSKDNGSSSVIVGTVQLQECTHIMKILDLPTCLDQLEYWKNKLRDGSSVYIWRLSNLEFLNDPYPVRLTCQKFRNRHFTMASKSLELGQPSMAPEAMSLFYTSHFFINLLSRKDYNKLKDVAQGLNGCVIRVGTTCSGSDIGITAIKSILKALNRLFQAWGANKVYI